MRVSVRLPKGGECGMTLPCTVHVAQWRTYCYDSIKFLSFAGARRGRPGHPASFDCVIFPPPTAFMLHISRLGDT